MTRKSPSSGSAPTSNTWTMCSLSTALALRASRSKRDTISSSLAKRDWTSLTATRLPMRDVLALVDDGHPTLAQDPLQPVAARQHPPDGLAGDRRRGGQRGALDFTAHPTMKRSTKRACVRAAAHFR